MFGRRFPSVAAHRAWIVTLVAVYVVYAAEVLRTIARPDVQTRLPVYLGIEFICLVLFTLMLWHPIGRQIGQHLYFTFQTLLVLYLLLLNPRFDFITVLFVILSFEAALVFPRRIWVWWVVILIALTIIPLTAAQGLYGLALSLTPLAACIIFPAYVSVSQELETGLRASQALLDELQSANRQLIAYAGQVEELSIIQEHNRLARELHDSVSQTLHDIIRLNQTARLVLERDPDHLSSELGQLQILAQSSLEQMRGLIASLRPANNGTAERPKP
jgi:signal transduction histidine kinase